jgi:hypothetical protein
MTKKITHEELKAVWNLPGCNWKPHNGEGGFCAAGKLWLLGVSFSDLSSQKRLSIYNLNNQGIYSDKLEDYGTPCGSSSYGPDNPKEWNKHEAAFKLALQYAIEEGVIEIEDETAKEFGLLNKEVPVNV